MLQEVFDDPRMNTELNLESRARGMMEYSEETLRNMGEAGKWRKDMEEEAEVKKLRDKHHVS